MVATNCYFVTNRKTGETIIVDPGAEAKRLQQLLQEDGKKPVAILLTHGHFDHAGAAGQLAEAYGISVYAAEAEKATLADANINLSGPMAGNATTYHADVFLRDEQEIDLAGFHIRVLYTPGHTPGGCCYYFPREDLVFSGDSLFCGSVGRTDFPGGSAAQLVQAVRDKLMILPENTLVLPGHDARTTIEQERMYNPFL
jgi:glyoxylase-like metal-dependent hydrolase (beta-lactamase superfamily II)